MLIYTIRHMAETLKESCLQRELLFISRDSLSITSYTHVLLTRKVCRDLKPTCTRSGTGSLNRGATVTPTMRRSIRCQSTMHCRSGIRTLFLDPSFTFNVSRPTV